MQSSSSNLPPATRIVHVGVSSDMRGLHWYDKVEKKQYTPPSTKEYKCCFATSLGELLYTVVPSCQAQLSALPVAQGLPCASSSSSSAQQYRLLLPWTDGRQYPFNFPEDTGSLKKTMLIKLLTYLLQHGPEHGTWMQVGAPLAKEAYASFYGLLEVRIPKDKVEAFSRLYGKLPLLRCWTEGAGLKRKTVVHAWHTGGFEEEGWGDGGARLVFRPERLRRMIDRADRCHENRRKRLRIAQELEGHGSPTSQSVTSFKRFSATVLNEYLRFKGGEAPAAAGEALLTSADAEEEEEVLLTSADVVEPQPQQSNDVIVVARGD